MAEKLRGEEAWKDTGFDYRKKAAAIEQQLETRLVYSYNGRSILAPLVWYCDDGGDPASCTAFLFNPSYVRVGYYLLSESSRLRKLAGDSQLLLARNVEMFGLRVPDWERITLSERGEFSIAASIQPAKKLASSFDAVRWPWTILWGGESSKQIAVKSLAGATPQEFKGKWGMPQEITLSMGFLLAATAEDRVLIDAYEGALMALANKHPGYFSDTAERYYNNSLARISVIFAYFPQFWQQPAKK
jgi:hypothetical protein